VGAATDANVEVKCLVAGVNPYLLVGAVVALGLAGIERRLCMSPECSGAKMRPNG
jgi:glutamine synthetase